MLAGEEEHREDLWTTEQEDDNPVYGIYYFGGDDEKIENVEIEMIIDYYHRYYTWSK